MVEIDTGHLATHLCNILMARPMETVTAHAILFVIFIGKGIHEVFGRNGLVERGVEHGDLRRVRQDILHRKDTFQIGRIVQGGQFEASLDLLFDGFVDDRAVLEIFAAMRHAVSDGRQFGNAVQYAVIGIHQCFEDQVDA